MCFLKRQLKTVATLFHSPTLVYTRVNMFGRAINQQQRCDYCHHIFPQVILVEKGECTGKFCSRLHFDMAYQHMKSKQVPEHNKKEEDARTNDPS